MPSPFDQSRYQVRLDWGLDALARLAPADVVVVVDVLRFSSTVVDVVDRGEDLILDDAAFAVSLNGARVTAAAAAAAGPEPAGPHPVQDDPAGPIVLLAGLRNASAVAQAIADEQARRGRRTSVSVIPAGELGHGGDPLRFAVEDLLGAGAVIDALATRGIDHSSPEAATAGESFRGLRGAVRHLLTASGSGQELIEKGLRDAVVRAAEIDASAAVPVARGDRIAGL
ncbi:2-phosphosulfolactate phosphatase [Microbacterium invictum]|uniref:Probable 2-phosphosulfolactate phosphatase n=1 Tax=Microbacterium invictum TaxID=515415 RepID=A0ABZ0VAV2_9MICO|nr:2-phosphosulfolactate phosphatase [Microbacterium invictum]WQB70023.1 2-phosphosulfolactate phosphatase [Microbacterium invictum]